MGSEQMKMETKLNKKTLAIVTGAAKGLVE
jgi:hypothetical protein